MTEYTYYKTLAKEDNWEKINKEEIYSIFLGTIWIERMEKYRMFIKKGKFRYKAIENINEEE